MATLLIVDDDEATLHSLSRLLELEGHVIHTATDGFHAMKRVAACPPDAILLDVRMPIANGVVFLRALRANPRYAWTPVAVITGDYFLDQSVTDELMRLGATIYFKPVWLSNLTEIVDRLLGQNP